jgi:hypothetical protein
MLSKIIPLMFILIMACHQPHPETLKIRQDVQNIPLDNSYKKISDIPLPSGYARINYPSDSFAEWLRNIGLKKDKAVHLYNGSLKNNQSAQFAVLDISVGKTDLQQCADAVMRLRAEYLYQKKDFDHIVFGDNGGTSYQFHSPYSRVNFDSYLIRVFEMCGSASLSKQLKNHVDVKDIQPGDVFIRGGFPGHAVTVMDVAQNNKGEKIYLLAQSYMPAQDIHVLVNPLNPELSPWYEVSNDSFIKTPEYVFSRDELKGW